MTNACIVRKFPYNFDSATKQTLCSAYEVSYKVHYYTNMLFMELPQSRNEYDLLEV